MKTAVERALESLQQKRKHFIGNHKDSSSIAETKGFLQGLDWAIDTIETEIENERCEEELRQVPTAEEVIEKMAKEESEYLADWEDKEMYQRGFIDGYNKAKEKELELTKQQEQ